MTLNPPVCGVCAFSSCTHGPSCWVGQWTHLYEPGQIAGFHRYRCKWHSGRKEGAPRQQSWPEYNPKDKKHFDMLKLTALMQINL